MLFFFFEKNLFYNEQCSFGDSGKKKKRVKTDRKWAECTECTAQGKLARPGRAPAARLPRPCCARPTRLPPSRPAARPRTLAQPTASPAAARQGAPAPRARALQRPARPRPCRPAPMPPARHARAPQACQPAERAQHARPARSASAQPANSQPQYNSFVLQPKTSHLSHDTIFFIVTLPSQPAIPLSPCNTKPSYTLLLAIKL